MSGEKSPHEDIIATTSTGSDSADNAASADGGSGQPDPREQKPSGGLPSKQLK
jgi:hypothetical protein